MKYKKYEGIFENDISDIFNKLSNTYKDGRFGYIDKTLRFKDFYKMLQVSYFLEFNDYMLYYFRKLIICEINKTRS